MLIITVFRYGNVTMEPPSVQLIHSNKMAKKSHSKKQRWSIKYSILDIVRLCVFSHFHSNYVHSVDKNVEAEESETPNAWSTYFLQRQDLKCEVHAFHLSLNPFAYSCYIHVINLSCRGLSLSTQFSHTPSFQLFILLICVHSAYWFDRQWRLNRHFCLCNEMNAWLINECINE